jgi:hypothetical protein
MKLSVLIISPNKSCAEGVRSRNVYTLIYDGGWHWMRTCSSLTLIDALKSILTNEYVFVKAIVVVEINTRIVRFAQNRFYRQRPIFTLFYEISRYKWSSTSDSLTGKLWLVVCSYAIPTGHDGFLWTLYYTSSAGKERSNKAFQCPIVPLVSFITRLKITVLVQLQICRRMPSKLWTPFATKLARLGQRCYPYAPFTHAYAAGATCDQVDDNLYNNSLLAMPCLIYFDVRYPCRQCDRLWKAAKTIKYTIQ